MAWPSKIDWQNTVTSLTEGKQKMDTPATKRSTSNQPSHMDLLKMRRLTKEAKMNENNMER